MALTPTEEALVRQLLDQQAAILSLAGNEATITSKLGATKVTLSDLLAASAVGDTDLFLTRQGVTDKSVTGAVLRDTLQTFLQDGTGAVVRAMNDKAKEHVSVKDFGAVGDGIEDDTDAIYLAYSSLQGTESKKRCLYFPNGAYKVSSLVFDDVVDFTFYFDNALLIAGALAATDSVVKIRNAFNVNFCGSLLVDGQGKTNYSSLFNITAAPGGTIDPIKGVATRIGVENLTTYNNPTGVKIGEYDNDAQISEITFYNFNSVKCPGVAHVGGSQTGVSFVGGNLTSEPNASFSGAAEYSIRNEGSFVTTSGCELTLTNSSDHNLVLMNPAQSALYGNPYGITRILGGHVETASPLCIISNPRALSAPYSAQSEFTIVGTGGYVSPGANAKNFIENSDSTYSGGMRVKSCNWYGSVGNVRSAYNIYSASNTAIIETDRTSWGVGFLNWLGGIVGGIVEHSIEQIAYIDNLNGQSCPNSATTGLVFSSKDSSGQYARYSGYYNATTGVLTVPPGGLQTLSISVICHPVSGTPAGVIQIYKNGSPDVAGVIAGNTLMISSDYSNVPSGTTFTFGFSNSSGGAVVFGTSGTDKLTIRASN